MFKSYNYFCESLSKANSCVLEIGCGPGNITKYLLNKIPQLSILGIDFAPNMIELARKNSPGAEFRTMDCRLVKELDIKFEGVVCGFCLPYLDDPDASKLINDCNYLLEENGVLYLSFVEGEKSESGFKVGSSGDKIYFNYFSIEEVKSFLTKSGFDVPEMFKVDYKRADNNIEVQIVFLTRKIRNKFV